MNLFGKVIRSNGLLRNSKLNRVLPLLMRKTPRHFSTRTEQNRTAGSFSRFLSSSHKQRSAFDGAMRTITRNGRLYSDAYRTQPLYPKARTAGKGVLVLRQVIPRIALPEDVEHLLFGSDLDLSSESVEILLQASIPRALRMALVHFPLYRQ
ncbi:hypothetical protein HHK36_016507 [Tetracentron sinense]|uniref:Uncharacterized protein n=1 Tax=Tetracentron sinense TaxID=13715 RepID=A0A834Z0G0_TETSI|nr:hypothetical protein HHK36_016507 [Tetracentron sinense]